MDFVTYSERLDYLLKLIENGQVCSPKIIGKRFNCSEKTIRNMINCLREKGFKIEYCKYSKKYLIKKITDGNNVSV